MLPDFVTGKLPADERQDLEAHLASCTECAREANEFKAVAAALQKIRPLNPPTNYLSTVLPRVRESLAGKSARREDPFIERILAPLAAMAIVVITLLQMPFNSKADLRAVLDELKSDELADVAVEPEYQSLYLIPSTESLASSLPDEAIDQKFASTILTSDDDAALVSMTELSDHDVTIILKRLGERTIL